MGPSQRCRYPLTLFLAAAADQVVAVVGIIAFDLAVLVGAVAATAASLE